MVNKIFNRKLREKMFHMKHQGEDMKKNKVIAVFSKYVAYDFIYSMRIYSGKFAKH